MQASEDNPVLLIKYQQEKATEVVLRSTSSRYDRSAPIEFKSSCAFMDALTARRFT